MVLTACFAQSVCKATRVRQNMVEELGHWAAPRLESAPAVAGQYRRLIQHVGGAIRPADVSYTLSRQRSQAFLQMASQDAVFGDAETSPEGDILNRSMYPCISPGLRSSTVPLGCAASS